MASDTLSVELNQKRWYRTLKVVSIILLAASACFGVFLFFVYKPYTYCSGYVACERYGNWWQPILIPIAIIFATYLLIRLIRRAVLYIVYGSALAAQAKKHSSDTKNDSDERVRLALFATEATIKRIRLPLTGILGFLDMFRGSSLTPTKKHFEMLETQVQKVIGEINQLEKTTTNAISARKK